MTPSATPTPKPRSTRRVALVTGAGKRIGRVIAERLAAAGFELALHYKHSKAEAEALAKTLNGAKTFQADLSKSADAEALVPRVIAEMGQLDAVVNNASLFEYDEFASLKPALAQALYATNTLAPVLLTQALYAHAQASATQCAVINLLDQKLFNPNPDFFGYTLSKAALLSAQGMLAQAMAPYLRVCGVAPGVTLLSGDMSEADFSAAHRMAPLGKSSEPADIAEAVIYLLNAHAVTGNTLIVDGGQHLLPLARDVAFLVNEK